MTCLCKVPVSITILLREVLTSILKVMLQSPFQSDKSHLPIGTLVKVFSVNILESFPLFHLAVE